MSLLTTIVFAISAVLFGGSAVVALAWAMKKGQMENFQRGATSIFDADEPIGMITDTFPRASHRSPSSGGNNG
jgi:cbb3-type cytochrome oxidase maturation protein